MPEQDDLSQRNARSRKFLEQLLADCYRASWPGGQDLIRQIEDALAALPPAENLSKTTPAKLPTKT